MSELAAQVYAAIGAVSRVIVGRREVAWDDGAEGERRSREECGGGEHSGLDDEDTE